MRALIWAVAVTVGLSALGAGEEAPAAGEPTTRLEALMAQDSAVVVRGFSRVGEVVGQRGSRLVVTSNEMRNAGTDERERQILLESADLERFRLLVQNAHENLAAIRARARE